MAIYRANTSFDYAGQQIRVGDVVEDDHYLFTRFPTRFTAQYAGGTALTDQSGGTATSGGTVAVIAAGTADATSAGLASTQNAIASLAAAIASIQSRLTS